MDKKELKELEKKVKIITDLNVSQFLKNIKEKALSWKDKLNGN